MKSERPAIVDEMCAIGTVARLAIEPTGNVDQKWGVWAYWDTGLGQRIQTSNNRISAWLYTVAFKEWFRQAGAPL